MSRSLVVPRRFAAGLLAVSGLLLGTLTPAHAAGTATISGTITGATRSGSSVPLDDTSVTLYADDGQGWQPVDIDPAYTSSTGRYSFSSVPAGTYRLEVNDPYADDDEVAYAGGFYGADTVKAFVEEGTSIVAADGSAKTVNVKLAKAGHADGKVTGPTADELGNISVAALRYNTVAQRWDETDSTDVAADDRTYSVTPLLAGTYRLQFSDSEGDYLTEYADDQPTLASAKEVTIAAGQGVTITTADLAKAGRVAGTVKDASGSAVPDADVLVQSPGPEPGSWTTSGRTSTDYDGTYAVGDLRTGSDYRVLFRADGYAQTLYDGAVVVTQGQTTRGVDVRLAAPGAVSGKVTRPDGAAAAKVDVTLLASDGKGGWQRLVTVPSGTDGGYAFTDVAPGTYKVSFDPQDDTYVAEYYLDAASLDAARSIVVSSGATTRLDTARLDLNGVITGTLKLPAGVTDSTALTVAAVDPATGQVRRSTRATRSGASSTYTYTLSGLPTGQYRVEFARAAGQTPVVGEYFRDRDESAGPDGAELVQVTAGSAATGSVDADLTTPGGTISGTLLDDDGAPARCLLTATSDGGTGSTRTATSSATTGRFTVAGLSPGAYRLTATGVAGGCHVGDTLPTLGYDADHEQGRLTDDTTAVDSITVGPGASVEVDDLYFGATAATFTRVGAPVVTGGDRVGQVLSAAGQAEPSGDADAQQWFRDGTAIPDATSPTYTITPADAGTTLTVRWTYRRADVRERTVTSAGTAVGAHLVTAPRISAKGKKLTTDAGTWGGSGWTYTYQWYRASSKTSTPVKISKATKSSYTTTRSDKRKYVTVRVTATKSGYTSATAASSNRVKGS